MNRFFLLVALMVFVAGCGDEKAKPTPALTEEMKAKIKAEDKAVEDEESQGSAGKKKKK